MGRETVDKLIDLEATITKSRADIHVPFTRIEKGGSLQKVFHSDHVVWFEASITSSDIKPRDYFFLLLLLFFFLFIYTPADV